jgi:hypothetical protein
VTLTTDELPPNTGKYIFVLTVSPNLKTSPIIADNFTTNESNPLNGLNSNESSLLF